MICSTLHLRRFAGSIVGAVLLSSMAAPAQKVTQSASPAQSIISLAPSAQPQGIFLARHPGDATFENAPANYHVFTATTAGEDTAAESLVLNFSGDTTLTGIKMTNKDFAIQPGGSCYEGNHYSAGQSCTLLVHFTPQGPGHRLGFVQVTHSAATSPTIFGLTANGYAPALSFIPAVITTVPSSVSAGVGTIKGSTNLAIDGGDILYIADTGNNKLKEMDSSGTIVPTALGPIATPASVAADSFGIVYTANVHGATYYFSIYYPWGTQTAYGYAYTSSTCTPGAPCAFSAVGMNYPANMSIDPYNNLFFEEGTAGAAEMPVANISGGSGTLNLWHLSDQFAYSSGSPGSFAVDANDNIYTKYSFSSTTCYLLREPLYNAEYSPTAIRVAGGIACGFTGDGGQAASAEISNSIGQIAFDIAGNIYFADAGNQRVRRIDAQTGIIRTIAGTGVAGYTGDGSWATHATLSNPTGVAVDSQGQVYILSGDGGTNQVLRKIGMLGRQAFPSTAVGKTATALKVLVTNTGNSSMSLIGTNWTGSNPGDFAVDTTTTTCPLTPGSSLYPGQSCNIAFLFTPTAVGSRTAYFNLLSNTTAGQNQILLSGSAVAAAKVNFATPTANAVLASNSSISVRVGVTSSYTAAPTGTVTFKVDGVQVGSPVSLVSSAASITVSGLAVGPHSLTATYSGDKHTASAHVTETITAQ